MVSLHALVPPLWLIHIAVAAVWFYEGLWCKLLGGEPHQLQVVAAVPIIGSRATHGFLRALGVVEVAIGAWVLCGTAPIACAVTQTALLAAMNAGGLVWARDRIHDAAGMIVKNVAFLVLAWVSASFPGWG
jgi:hypothetical protein